MENVELSVMAKFMEEVRSLREESASRSEALQNWMQAVSVQIDAMENRLAMLNGQVGDLNIQVGLISGQLQELQQNQRLLQADSARRPTTSEPGAMPGKKVMDRLAECEEMLDGVASQMESFADLLDNQTVQVDTVSEQVAQMTGQLHSLAGTAMRIELIHGQKLDALFDGYAQCGEQLVRIGCNRMLA